MKICTKCKKCSWYKIDFCKGQAVFISKDCPVEKEVNLLCVNLSALSARTVNVFKMDAAVRAERFTKKFVKPVSSI